MKKPQGKRFLGQKLTFSRRPGPPKSDCWDYSDAYSGLTIHLAHVLPAGLWYITVWFCEDSFQSHGETERIARAKFKNRLTILKGMIEFLEKKAK